MRADCVKVCLLHTSFRPQQIHAPLVSRQRFPHLWKKLWKIARILVLVRVYGRKTQISPSPDLHLRWRKSHEIRIFLSRLSEEMNLWDEILARIETKVNRHSFYTWFRPTTLVAEDRGSVTVRVPNPLFKEWLTKHYAGVMAEAMTDLNRPNLSINFVAEGVADMPAIPLTPEEAATVETGPPATTQPGPAGLNPRYTFDSFIVGSSNQFAHAACRAVAEAPSR